MTKGDIWDRVASRIAQHPCPTCHVKAGEECDGPGTNDYGVHPGRGTRGGGPKVQCRYTNKINKGHEQCPRNVSPGSKYCSRHKGGPLDQ